MTSWNLTQTFTIKKAILYPKKTLNFKNKKSRKQNMINLN